MSTARRFTSDHFSVTVAGLLTATIAPLALWSVGGLESTLCAFLYLAGVDRLLVESDQESERPLSVALFALAALARIDGFVWGPLPVFS